MVEPWVVLQHGILRLAEIGQEIINEPVQHLHGVGARDRKSKVLQLAEVAGKQRFNRVQNLRSDRIRRKLNVLWPEEIRLCRFTVLGIEIPASTKRFVTAHQKSGLSPHLPIEKLHRQRFAALGPMPKLAVRADKAAIAPDIDLKAKGARPTPDFLENTPFAGLCDAYGSGTELDGRALSKRASVVWIVDPGVADLVAGSSQLISKMPHCRKDEGDFLLVMADIGRLGHHLAHEHGIAAFVCAVQRRDTQRQLVSKDEDQPRQENSSSSGSFGRPPRDAGEVRLPCRSARRQDRWSP